MSIIIFFFRLSVTSNDRQPKTKNRRAGNDKWRENENEGNLMISKSTNKENDGQVGLDEEEVDNGPNKLRQGPKIENGSYKPEIQRLQELTEAEQDAREFLEAMYEDSSAGADS